MVLRLSLYSFKEHTLTEVLELDFFCIQQLGDFSLREERAGGALLHRVTVMTGSYL